MTEANELRRFNELLVELQTQLAFQEETIGVLDATVARQQEEITRLRREWELVQQRYASLQAQMPQGTVDEKPPHY